MKKVKSAIYSRLPWERMMKIHEKIKAGGWPNCVQMAVEMEVSVRTLKRDIEFMQERLKMPIEYDRQRHGFYYTRPVDHLPSMPMTETEIFAMLVAHKAIAQYHGTPYQRPLQMAFKKIVGKLDRDERYTMENLQEALSFRPFAPEDTDLRIFQTITRALQGKRVVRFKYKNLGAKAAQERLAHPYHLACIENHWYLFAWDEPASSQQSTQQRQRRRALPAQVSAMQPGTGKQYLGTQRTCLLWRHLLFQRRQNLV